MAASAKDLRLHELKDSISQLNKRIDALLTALEAANAREAELRRERDTLKEQVDFLTKKLFGKSSEKRTLDIPGQLNLFNEAEQEQGPEPPAETIVVAEHTRKKKSSHADTFKGMKVNKVLIPLPDEEKVCPVCGTQMERIGEEYVRRELVFIPATCEINEYYTETYGCPSCKEGKGDTEAAVFAKSQAPDALICKSPASSSTVAWTMYQKYANGMPLYRQEKDWKQYGAAISRTTLANWIIYCAEHYFQPVYHYLHRLLLKRQFAMADETRIQVLNAGQRPSRSCGCSAVGKTDFRLSSCTGTPLQEAVITLQNSCRDFRDTWKPMGIRATIKFPGSGDVPAGHIYGDTLSTRFPKGNSLTTASRPYRAYSTATAYSGWRMQSTGRPGKITKNAGSFVSRRRNRFLRLFGRGLTVFSRYGTPDWTKQSLISGTAGARQRHIWKTADAALQTI